MRKPTALKSFRPGPSVLFLLTCMGTGAAIGQTIPVVKNPWPMQLGNQWEYRVSIDEDEFRTWTARRGSDCEGFDFSAINDSTTRLTVMPANGVNRFYTSRFVRFEKQNGGAYHGNKFCNYIPEAPNSWNLRWYMRHPIADAGTDKPVRWMGSEGGVRWARSVLNVTQGYPKETTFHSGKGRTPIYEGGRMNGLPGYTYLPLTAFEGQANSPNGVVADVVYAQDMGGPVENHDELMNLLINEEFENSDEGRIDWKLEYVGTKVKHVLTEPVAGLDPDTKVLGVLFYEPYKRSPDAACEAYYFAENTGLIRVDASRVRVVPNDSQWSEQLCYSLFRLRDDAGRSVFAVPDVIFNADDPAMAFHDPVTSMQATSFSLVKNQNQDGLGFHSPDAASMISLPQPNTQLYMSNGKYWYFLSSGELHLHGSVKDAWKGKAPEVDGVYPWSNAGPQAIEYEGAMPLLLGQGQGLVVNRMKYWVHDYTTKTFPAAGRVNDLFPGFPWTDTHRLGITTDGVDKIFMTKDGHYVYYQRVGGRFQKVPGLEGKLWDLPKWGLAPSIGGHATVFDALRPADNPDTMMYGELITPDDGPEATTTKDLLVFKKGAAWLRYGLDGEWERWAGHMH